MHGVQTGAHADTRFFSVGPFKRNMNRILESTEFRSSGIYGNSSSAVTPLPGKILESIEFNSAEIFSHTPSSRKPGWTELNNLEDKAHQSSITMLFSPRQDVQRRTCKGVIHKIMLFVRCSSFWRLLETQSDFCPFSNPVPAPKICSDLEEILAKQCLWIQKLYQSIAYFLNIGRWTLHGSSRVSHCFKDNTQKNCSSPS